MKLRKRALGMALGIVWGLSVFAVTIWANALGIGKTLSKLGGYYLGYHVSFAWLAEPLQQIPHTQSQL